MPVTKKQLTVTSDGRTIVDANLLFETEEVKAFLKAMRAIHEKKSARKIRPKQEELKARAAD